MTYSRILSANGVLPKGERLVVGENATIDLWSGGEHLLLVSFPRRLGDQAQLFYARSGTSSHRLRMAATIVFAAAVAFVLRVFALDRLARGFEFS